MKLKALLLALAVAGVAASFGLTDTGRSDTGTTTGATTTTTSSTTTTTSSDGCRRFELRGKLVSVSSASFTVDVAKGNKAAKDSVGTTVTVAVIAETRVSWSGRGTLTGPNAGDSVKVEGKQCGSTLTASKLDARGAGKDSEHKAAKTETTSKTSATATTSKSDDKGGKNGKDGKGKKK